MQKLDEEQPKKDVQHPEIERNKTFSVAFSKNFSDHCAIHPEFSAGMFIHAWVECTYYVFKPKSLVTRISYNQSHQEFLRDMKAGYKQYRTYSNQYKELKE